MDTIKAMAEKYAETSDLSHRMLLSLIEKWRKLQSGASDKKAPSYSSEQ